MRINRWRTAPLLAALVLVVALVVAQRDAGGQPASCGTGLLDPDVATNIVVWVLQE